MSDQSLLIKIATDLATNTEATKNIEKHLATLNGKVAAQEAFGNTLKGAVDLHNTAIDGLMGREKDNKDRRSRLAWLTVDNIFKLVFGLIMTYLIYKSGF